MAEETLSVSSHLTNSQIVVVGISSCDLIKESQGVLPTKSNVEEFVEEFVWEQLIVPVRQEINTI